MAYATTTDLARFGLPAAILASIATATQEAALEAASDVADSYLRARYTLPLTSYGDDLKRAVCNIAAWDLLSTRGYDPKAGNDEAVEARSDKAMAWLKDISAGRAAVSGGNTTPTPTRDTRVSSGPVTRSDSQRGW